MMYPFHKARRKESGVSTMSLLELFCAVDDFWQGFAIPAVWQQAQALILRAQMLNDDLRTTFAAWHPEMERAEPVLAAAA
jgi:hypothetical protein